MFQLLPVTSDLILNHFVQRGLANAGAGDGHGMSLGLIR